MTRVRCLALAVLLLPAAAFALPTMVRLGYSNCAACHVSPQGGGVLTDYGRVVDDAQSLREGEYTPSASSFARWLNATGRVRHDVRAVAQGIAAPQSTWLLSALYRNETSVSERHRLGLTVQADSVPPRPQEPSAARVPHNVRVLRALWQYRFGNRYELAVGRDVMPVGVMLGDASAYHRAYNGLGPADVATQAKLFWWSASSQVTALVFGPSLEEARSHRELGASLLAETSVLASPRIVLGASGLAARSAAFERAVGGVYARLGFGSWGSLAEVDFTARRPSGAPGFLQVASMAQVFWAPREWAVPSVSVEHVWIEAPFARHHVRVKPEIALRLTPSLSVTAALRAERDLSQGTTLMSALLQVAAKTVD